MKEEVEQVALGEIGGIVSANQTGFDGGLFDSLIVNAAAVVFDLNKDMVAAVVSTDCDIADVSLAGFIARIVCCWRPIASLLIGTPIQLSSPLAMVIKIVSPA